MWVCESKWERMKKILPEWLNKREREIEEKEIQRQKRTTTSIKKTITTNDAQFTDEKNFIRCEHNIQIKWTLLKITMLTLSLQIELFRLIDYAWYDWGLCKSLSFKPIWSYLWLWEIVCICVCVWVCCIEWIFFHFVFYWFVFCMFQIGWQTIVLLVIHCSLNAAAAAAILY